MRRPISQQMSFGDGFIDASLYELDEELKKVDELLSNAQLLKPSKRFSIRAWVDRAQR
jgi:hypothetical protein